ncbi:MAG: hypothetical protein LC745_09795 [Planctomycetia bacterium]|nr:hypothetical protein [Planctomycetia bacterium]
MKFKVPDSRPTRVDWKDERQRIDLAEVIAREYGRPVMRKGRPWWVCPFHDDKNPSLVVKRSKGGRPYFRCYGCDARGDAATFVMRFRSMTFPEAVAHLTGKPAPSGKTAPRPGPAPRPEPKPPAGPSGMPEADALALVEAAAARLWTPEGTEALAYLKGPDRCLCPETIRTARLGWTPKADRVAWKPPGVVIPWFIGGRLALVKVRPSVAWRERFPEGKGKRPPKYLEAFRDPARLVCYADPEAIRPGRPLVICGRRVRRLGPRGGPRGAGRRGDARERVRPARAPGPRGHAVRPAVVHCDRR